MSDIPRDAKGHFLKGAGTPWTPEQARENAKKGQAALQAKNSEATRESADRILREDAKIEGGWDAASEGMRKLLTGYVVNFNLRHKSWRWMLPAAPLAVFNPFVFSYPRPGALSNPKKRTPRARTGIRSPETRAHCAAQTGLRSWSMPMSGQMLRRS